MGRRVSEFNENLCMAIISECVGTKTKILIVLFSV